MKKINKFIAKQEPYNHEDLQKDVYEFRKKQQEKKPYGKLTDQRYLKSEALVFRLIMDIYDRNSEGLDLGLKDLVDNLMKLGFLQKILPPK